MATSRTGRSTTTGPVPVVLGERIDAPIACTLSTADIPARVDDWARLLDHVVGREALAGADTGIRLELSPAAPLDELVRLVTAERSCCSFFAFAITVDARGVALEVRAPKDAREVVEALFGSAD